ncbi:DEAD/DEAH box helicase [Pseudidiomarina terrestris]|uniref:DEAD/DEAH box helicase n=1 Tax=Pseudidiomarina terrestris TaxID=2820060 RepID=UPI002655275E|nr:DEAD/DEAH box helicase [Pseudidiomarina sp. 1ASP75-5]MDN7136021.1 DEAD/DEAH box helicase [Pseudidiomarina sp. 1ASP75-5]
MPIDFSDLLDDDDEVVLHPRDIFFTLNRGPSFSFPRDIQTEVMNQWFERRNERDSIIKLNVGSGKTLIGLLHLQSSLNESKGPALYVSPDKQLSQQVMQEAKSLGIEVTDNPRDPDYLAGEKICVINVFKLFNGKSVFGVGNSKIDIGTVVIDDAHACVSTITEQFRISLPNTHEAYQEIFSTLAEDLKGYNEARFLDLEASDPRAHMEVPFWSWHVHHSEILKILHEHRSDSELEFVYPLLSELLAQCRCVIGGQYLEIEPYFPASDLIQSFRRAKRRIYMTATLADDSVIVTHFGANHDDLSSPIVPSSSQSMGERMILMPQELNADITTIEIRDLLSELSERVNIVVIVPSKAAVRIWEEKADQVLIGDAVAEGVKKLREGHVGLTILVNRYDGIDLPRDACRVLVVADLPEVNSYSDLVDSEVLSGTSLNLRRQIERIEQGMGRGVRSNEDYCVVLLLGPKLTSRLRAPEGQSMLTPSTRAQLELSRKIARKLGATGLKEIEDVILQCLNRDPNWIKISKKVLLNLESDDELRFDAGKLALRSAFDSARMNQHQAALSVIDKVIDEASDDHIKAWLLSKKAVFQHAIDADGAQKTLIVAHRMEPSITKPMHGVTYKTIGPAIGQQASALISNHQSRFLDATQMQLFADELCADLQFKPETSDIFEAAINSLAWFLGIKGQRPEKDYKEGPDNLWALPDSSFLVIECKNGVTSSNGISKRDAGQLGQSIGWFEKRYPASSVIPIIIHPNRELGQGASLVNSMRVIDPAGLEKLRTNLRALSKQLVNPDVSGSMSEVIKRLNQFELKADTFINAFSVPVKA